MIPRRPEWWRAYWGAPYAFRGRSLETGIGCWELVPVVYLAEFGRHVDDFGLVHPTPAPEGPALRRQIATAITAELPGWREVEWEEGAVALFRIAGLLSHVGLCLPTRGFVLHACESAGAVDTLDFQRSPKWRPRFVACYLPV